jgi:hypothetical protein
LQMSRLIPCTCPEPSHCPRHHLNDESPGQGPGLSQFMERSSGSSGLPPVVPTTFHRRLPGRFVTFFGPGR